MLDLDLQYSVSNKPAASNRMEEYGSSSFLHKILLHVTRDNKLMPLHVCSVITESDWWGTRHMWTGECIQSFDGET